MPRSLFLQNPAEHLVLLPLIHSVFKTWGGRFWMIQLSQERHLWGAVSLDLGFPLHFSLSWIADSYFFEQQHARFTTCFYNKLELLLLKKTASFQLLDIMIFQLYLGLLSQVVVDVCTQHWAQTTRLCPLLGRIPVLYSSHLLQSFQGDAPSLQNLTLGKKYIWKWAQSASEKGLPSQVLKERLGRCSTVMVKLLTRGCKSAPVSHSVLSNGGDRPHSKGTSTIPSIKHTSIGTVSLY